VQINKNHIYLFFFKALMNILIINGPNLNLLGMRNTKVYGSIDMQNILEEYSSMGRSRKKYQCFAGYYLTESECKLLKANMLVSVAYRTNSGFEKGTTHIDVQENKFTLRSDIFK